MKVSPRASCLLAVSLLSAACGGGSGPSAPSAPPSTGATPASTPAASPAPSVTPTPSGPTILRRASIAGAAGHSASGTAEIVRNGSAITLELRSDFRIDSGNNDVILTNSTSSMDGGLNLGDMKATTGAQSYSMPNDGSGFRYVILWCRPFRIPIGVGELR